MTKKEKIIVSAYTGYLMCDFADMQKYIEEKVGRPVFTHELADEKVMEEVRAKVKPDFIELCKPNKTYVPSSKCSCGASSGYFKLKEEALKRWNRRTANETD